MSAPALPRLRLYVEANYASPQSSFTGRVANPCPRPQLLPPNACLWPSIRYFPSERKICSDRGPSLTQTLP